MAKGVPQPPRTIEPQTTKRWMGGVKSAFDQAVFGSEFSGDPNIASVQTGDYGDLLVNRNSSEHPLWANISDSTEWSAFGVLDLQNVWTESAFFLGESAGSRITVSIQPSGNRDIFHRSDRISHSTFGIPSIDTSMYGADGIVNAVNGGYKIEGFTAGVAAIEFEAFADDVSTNPAGGGSIIMTSVTSDGAGGSSSLSDDANLLAIRNDTTTVLRVTGNGGTGIGLNTDNSFMDLGLTINQGASDSEILTLKSSDVAHGVTNQTDTNTFGKFAKIGTNGGSEGGLNIEGFHENGRGILLQGTSTTSDQEENTGAVSPCEIRAWIKDSSGRTAFSAGDNIFTVRNGDITRMLLKSGGDLYIDGNYQMFDEWDDVELLKAYTHCMDPSRCSGSSKYSTGDLESVRITGKEDPATGRRFTNVTNLIQLCSGAIRQVHEQKEQLKMALQALLDANPDLAGREEAAVALTQ